LADRTTVISVRGRNRFDLLVNLDFVYVGRSVWRAGWNRASLWGNPFKSSKHQDLQVVVDNYERKIREAISLDLDRHPEPGQLLRYAYAAAVQAELPKLQGKTLGCWCCDWDGTGEPAKPCHAVILARLADQFVKEANFG
jgi:hypothetical protein